MKLGDLIKSARKKKGWIQRQLADQIGTSASFVTQLERSQCFPSYERALKIAHVLGLDSDSLWEIKRKTKLEKDREEDKVRKEVLEQRLQMEGESENIWHNLTPEELSSVYQSLTIILNNPHARMFFLNILKSLALFVSAGNSNE